MKIKVTDESDANVLVPQKAEFVGANDVSLCERLHRLHRLHRQHRPVCCTRQSLARSCRGLITLISSLSIESGLQRESEVQRGEVDVRENERAAAARSDVLDGVLDGAVGECRVEQRVSRSELQGLQHRVHSYSFIAATLK